MINFKQNQVQFELIGNNNPLNIYPSEVEDVLYKHSAVEECSVVGMPHPEYGKAVTALVIKKQDRICAEDNLILFCKQRIASYKAPKKIMFVKDLPKSPAGKIFKRVIRKSSNIQ